MPGGVIPTYQPMRDGVNGSRIHPMPGLKIKINRTVAPHDDNPSNRVSYWKEKREVAE